VGTIGESVEGGGGHKPGIKLPKSGIMSKPLASMGTKQVQLRRAATSTSWCNIAIAACCCEDDRDR
jgi:hypothetical protein